MEHKVVRRKVIVKGSGGVSATITVTVERGWVLVSIEPLFTSAAILDVEKIEEVIRTLRQAAEDAQRMGRGKRDVETEKNRFGPGLQGDQKLYRAKLIAGMISVLALVAMFITSLYRAPNPVWSVVVGVTALGLAVAIGVRVARRHRR